MYKVIDRGHVVHRLIMQETKLINSKIAKFRCPVKAGEQLIKEVTIKAVSTVFFFF